MTGQEARFSLWSLAPILIVLGLMMLFLNVAVFGGWTRWRRSCSASSAARLHEDG